MCSASRCLGVPNKVLRRQVSQLIGHVTVVFAKGLAWGLAAKPVLACSSYTTLVVDSFFLKLFLPGTRCLIRIETNFKTVSL